MQEIKFKNRVLTTLLLCSLASSFTFAQTNEAAKAPIKTQKYNGYGLPNTKFKKIKVDLTKKKKTETQITPPLTETPATVTPQSLPQTTNSGEAAATATPTTAPAKWMTFSFDYSFSYNAQMEEQENHAREEYYQHEFIPKISFGDYSLLGDFFYYDNIKSPGSNEWQDSAFIANRKAWELGRNLTLAPAVSLVLPLSKSSREDAGIKYVLGTSLTLGLNTKNLGFDKLGLNYSLGYSKFSTEFNTKPNGDPSADYRIRQRINLSYQFTEKFSFKTRFQYDSSYSNQGVVKNSYLHFEAFEYQFTSVVSGSIAHATGSSVYTISEKAGDILFENDLKFYDPKNSEISVGVGLSF